MKDETKDAAVIEVAVGDDANEHVLKALAQVGILYTDSQKTDLKRQLAESMLKRRKRSDGQQSGQP